MIGSLERDEGKNGGMGPVDGAQNDGREVAYADPTVEDLGLVRGGIGCGSGLGIMLGVLRVVVRVELVVVGVVIFVVLALVPANLGVALPLPPFAAGVWKIQNNKRVKTNRNYGAPIAVRVIN
ncbi:hypothetical protein ACFX2J_043599 [Malus domestica]